MMMLDGMHIFFKISRMEMIIVDADKSEFFRGFSHTIGDIICTDLALYFPYFSKLFKFFHVLFDSLHSDEV